MPDPSKHGRLLVDTRPEPRSRKHYPPRRDLPQSRARSARRGAIYQKARALARSAHDRETTSTHFLNQRGEFVSICVSSYNSNLVSGFAGLRDIPEPHAPFSATFFLAALAALTLALPAHAGIFGDYGRRCTARSPGRSSKAKGLRGPRRQTHRASASTRSQQPRRRGSARAASTARRCAARPQAAGAPHRRRQAPGRAHRRDEQARGRHQTARRRAPHNLDGVEAGGARGADHFLQLGRIGSPRDHIAKESKLHAV